MTTDIKRIFDAFGPVIHRKVVEQWCVQNGIHIPHQLFVVKANGRGMYDISRFQNMVATETLPSEEVRHNRTPEQIRDQVAQRFQALDDLAFGVIGGFYRSAVVSGNAGIGKTYGLEYILDGAKEAGEINLDIIRGFVKATGIYKILYKNREAGNVIVFDDADSVFDDVVGLNLLKAALDTTKKRWISWRSERPMELNDGEAVPDEFEYKGSIIFISNIDFDVEVQRQNMRSPHMKALISRSNYINLNLDDEELTERIASVIRESDMMYQLGIDDVGQAVILDYFFEFSNLFREKSLRTIVKLGNIYRASKTPEKFITMANATCLNPKLQRSLPMTKK
jgi:hypothetical protein